jgi:hypothetical protein
MAFKYPKISKECAADKRKHATLIIPQKTEILTRLGSGKTCRVIMVAYGIGLSTQI